MQEKACVSKKYSYNFMVLSLNPINNIYNINSVALESAVEVWDLPQHRRHMSKITTQQNTTFDTTSDQNTG